MIASSGKGLSNLMQGTYLNLGDYDQCLLVASSEFDHFEMRQSAPPQFNGKYCLLHMAPQRALLSAFGSSQGVKASEFFDPTLNVSQKLDVLFRFSGVINSKIGFCLPSSCSDGDVTVLVNTGRLIC